MSVLLELSVGDIVIDLYCNERPRCCFNFLKLCRCKYYNFCLFYDLQKNFMALTGDPTATGKGGVSIYARLADSYGDYFPLELQPKLRHRKMGTVSMLNPNTNSHGSQFFITLAKDKDHLDDIHTVFGEVVEGLDVLEQFNNWYCDREHRPFKDIRIYHTIVLHDPFPDPEDLLIPPDSPIPTQEMIKSDRIGVDDIIDETEDLTQEELEEYVAEKEARANAQILEIIGDIPSYDIKPSETMLFVCKLNAVTTSEDLELIFSRFGEIRSCEVVQDYKTGSSLQYAFIDFATVEACEQAYLKMENVLLDDRRIHVDFSQSVAKEWWRFRDYQKFQSSSVSSPSPKTSSKSQRRLRRQRSNLHKNAEVFDFVFDHQDDRPVVPPKTGRCKKRPYGSSKDLHTRSYRERSSGHSSHPNKKRSSRSSSYDRRPLKPSPPTLSSSSRNRNNEPGSRRRQEVDSKNHGRRDRCSGKLHRWRDFR